MPRALLDRNLLGDALVGVVDDIRRSVHGALGTRPWRVSIITRSWSGGALGIGNFTDSVLVLDPDPMVERGGGADRKSPGGVEGTTAVKLSGVSLSYTEDELKPRKLQPGVEVVYMLELQHGGEASRAAREFFTVNETPTPRRGDKPGDASDWVINLHEVQGFAFYDGTDA